MMMLSLLSNKYSNSQLLLDVTVRDFFISCATNRHFFLQPATRYVDGPAQHQEK
jgi:hypothetical protein